MSSPKGHDRLERRFSLTGHIVCESALHIGTGSAVAGTAASDLPVARDGQGHPYIPGSSFRGAYRSSLESLLRGLDQDRLQICNPFETTEGAEDRSCSERVKVERSNLHRITEASAFDLAWKKSCPICRLFGQLFLASRVRIADLALRLEAATLDTYVRDGVGLDRDLKTAAHKILYDFEAVPAGARFSLKMEVDNPEDHEIGLILTGLDLLGDGLFTIGGKSSRGLGAARVENLEVVSRTAKDFFTGDDKTPVDSTALESLREAARRFYVEEAH